MDFKEIIQFIMYTVVSVSVPVIVKYFVVWLQEKTNQTKFEHIGLIIAAVVEETNQTYSDALKEQGRFNKDAQKNALRISLEKTVELLSVDLKRYIESNFGECDKYLTSRIESYIKTSKQG